MGFMDGNKIKHVVTAKDLDVMVRDAILDACDFSTRTVGRPRHRLLGTDPVQMNNDVAHRVVDLVLDQIAASGGELETRLGALNDRTGRRQYAQRLLGRMSRLNDAVISDDPVERLWKMLGDLVAVGRRRVGDGRPQTHYVAKKGAREMEVRAAWNARRMKGADRDVRDSRVNDIFARGLPGMASDVDFSEHYARSLEAYHKRKLQ